MKMHSAPRRVLRLLTQILLVVITVAYALPL